MMGNFFNRMYYGKSGKEDYTRDDLPDNRWQLFLAMIRLNFGKLVTTNLLFVLFFLPLYIWVVTLNMPLLNHFLEKGASTDVQAVIVQTIYGIAPCLVLMSPGVVGMTYITRNMARDENVWVWADFWYAVKSNWKQMLAMSALNGLVLILSYVAIVFYGAMLSESMFYLVPRVLIFALALIWLCMNFYAWPMMVTYELKMKDLLKNAAILSIARLPQTVFMLLIIMILPALLLFGTNAYVYIATYAVFIICGFSIWSMAINSITTAIFDRFINVRIKGARVNRGLSTAYDEYAAENSDMDQSEKTPEDAQEASELSETSEPTDHE